MRQPWHAWPRRQCLKKLRCRHWPCKQIALLKVHAITGQIVALHFGFHAFGDDAQAQLPRQFDDTVEDML
ncbi:hypothetical protein D3C79_1062740 [compost metagenome]